MSIRAEARLHFECDVHLLGATAIDRFLRPVCYQDLPDTLLPDALKQSNLRVDGGWSTAK
ncbi:hypothetical protein K788_0006042 (plasmid) [Paraburkholderia caribensis MBA4]|uniref:Uncharacterized protein n=1 Tax=Paraburkholderia caribensis MBA4 TaxID=1323664 RepID=A0A0P0RRA3_9BURK|nr:hypothetical protein [Paraburkholderia caribensis]ALL71550.1 hypothetical protein K788_0006042 [Paraburkholderia caribensis MBA4]